MSFQSNRCFIFKSIITLVVYTILQHDSLVFGGCQHNGRHVVRFVESPSPLGYIPLKAKLTYTWLRVKGQDTKPRKLLFD